MHRDLPLTSCPPPAIPPLFLSSPLPVQRRMAGPLTLFSLIVPFVISLFAFTLERYPSSSPPLPFFPSLPLPSPFSRIPFTSSFLVLSSSPFLFSSPCFLLSLPLLFYSSTPLPFLPSILPLCRASSIPFFPSFLPSPLHPSLPSPSLPFLPFPSILCCHRATSSLYAPLPFPSPSLAYILFQYLSLSPLPPSLSSSIILPVMRNEIN